jgi:cholesterol transport system auxiliary component
MKSTLNRIVLLVLCTSVATLSGCSGFFETKVPAPTTYILTAPTASGERRVNLNVDLAISLPAAAPGLDTERIAALHEQRRLDYFRDVQWGAPAANVVQSLLAATLAQGGFHSVAPEQSRLSATHLVDLQLRDFQAEYRDEHAPPVVHVSLVASVLRMKDRKLLATFPVVANVAATQNNMGAVIAAYEAATQNVALALSAQVQSVVSE